MKELGLVSESRARMLKSDGKTTRHFRKFVVVIFVF